MKLQQIKFFIIIGIVLGVMNACSKQTNYYPTYSKRQQTTQKPASEKKNEEKPAIISKTETKTEIKVDIVDKKDKPKEEIPMVLNLPKFDREFRAAWIASVANINWPSKKNLTTEQQKAEAIYLLDMLKEHNFNAVIFQARPSGDALYASKFEPWSYFLTGETGRAPYPYYDPLEFWVEEAHKRGLELHVWLNPYRAHHSNGGKVSSQSIVNKMPSQIVKLKNGMYWFDPADKTTQDHASDVVMDIVKRYNIDGIHFDDYFYPYASYNGGADFPDYITWSAYQGSGGKLSRGDWRRENVNQFIKRIYKEIKEEKDYVKFGISPFGIWKPGFPNGVSGMSQYDELYADAKLWLNEGWIDYFTPQLYWPVDAPKQNFASLLNWWESENTHQRHLWPGLNTVEIRASDKPAEIIKQIEITRQLVPKSAGVAHWSTAGLTSSMLYSLKAGPYKEKALIPKSPWLKPLNLDKPNLFILSETNSVKANWSLAQNNEIINWLLFTKYGEVWEKEILDSSTFTKEIDKQRNGKNLDLIVIQGIDRLGNETEYVYKKVS
ncbi:glycoside hydrolase family 10 protein [Moheibacter sediminis]|uniref:Uncharacterized lipoprotein YddW, UPF0748 family n=1 Tax=Moheibacter sediminis TaxID=1434700 RepID=A0A1W2B019_9FLAO|nr:family 10 glycosylhydrolase [Moheibacter sediminis]SMC66194.1 Uncharacterized lipoprotein YddW, UPF0748 family [Moheibacter sediminis]